MKKEPSMDRAVIDRIQGYAEDGMPPDRIASTLGVSEDDVRRHTVGVMRAPTANQHIKNIGVEKPADQVPGLTAGKPDAPRRRYTAAELEAARVVPPADREAAMRITPVDARVMDDAPAVPARPPLSPTEAEASRLCHDEGMYWVDAARLMKTTAWTVSQAVTRAHAKLGLKGEPPGRMPREEAERRAKEAKAQRQAAEGAHQVLTGAPISTSPAGVDQSPAVEAETSPPPSSVESAPVDQFREATAESGPPTTSAPTGNPGADQGAGSAQSEPDAPADVAAEPVAPTDGSAARSVPITKELLDAEIARLRRMRSVFTRDRDGWERARTEAATAVEHYIDRIATIDVLIANLEPTLDAYSEAAATGHWRP